MKLFGRVGQKQESSRREVAARRQAQLRGEETPSPHSYQRNRILNSRQTATPAETSERLATQKLAEQRRRLTHRLGWVLLGALLVLIVLWQAVVSVTVIAPQALSADDARRYRSVLESYYGERPAERLRFMLDDTSLKGYFLTHAPEVKTVRIESNGIAAAHMKVTFRQPVVQWTSTGTVYFVDDDGVTFERNYFTPPAVTVRDESGVSAVAGQEVINRQFLSFLGQAVSAFKKEQVVVTEVVLPVETVRQVLFQLAGRPYPVKMTIDRGATAQVAEAMKAMRHLDAQGVSPQYIDVRVDQRVFYRE